MIQKKVSKNDDPKEVHRYIAEFFKDPQNLYYNI